MNVRQQTAAAVMCVIQHIKRTVLYAMHVRYQYVQKVLGPVSMDHVVISLVQQISRTIKQT